VKYNNGPDLDDDLVSFSVWPRAGSDADVRCYRAESARNAAERAARDDYDPAVAEYAYGVRDGESGKIWSIVVGVVPQPSFVAIDAQEIEMPAGTHVLWGGHALCEDMRLRGVPRDWPAGQRWISLKDVADGAARPVDGCATCWDKAPGLVEGFMKIGKRG